MSELILAVFDGGGKFLYQTSLGVKDSTDGSNGQEADMEQWRINGKLNAIKWRDADGKIHYHRHDQGAFGYAILHDGVRIARAGQAPK